MTGQIVGYVRVSSLDQNPDRQLAAIGEVDERFTDTVSGKSRAARVGLAAMLRHTRHGDTVRVASMDRLARSVVDLSQLVEELTGRGVSVAFVAERVTFTPLEKGQAGDHLATFQLHMLGAVAQLERSLIRERQREGIELAKAKGVYRGRARRLDVEQIERARQAVAVGVPKAKVARDLGCSRRVLYDALDGRGAYADHAPHAPMPAPASQQTSTDPGERAAVDHAETETVKKRRTPAQRWHVVEGSRSHADAAVVIVGSYTTERTATGALRKMLKKGVGAGDPNTDVTVRPDDQITAWMSFDVTAGRTVTHQGPPPRT